MRSPITSPLVRKRLGRAALPTLMVGSLLALTVVLLEPTQSAPNVARAQTALPLELAITTCTDAGGSSTEHVTGTLLVDGVARGINGTAALDLPGIDDRASGYTARYRFDWDKLGYQPLIALQALKIQIHQASTTLNNWCISRIELALYEGSSRTVVWFYDGNQAAENPNAYVGPFPAAGKIWLGSNASGTTTATGVRFSDLTVSLPATPNFATKVLVKVCDSMSTIPDGPIEMWINHDGVEDRLRLFRSSTWSDDNPAWAANRVFAWNGLTLTALQTIDTVKLWNGTSGNLCVSDWQIYKSTSQTAAGTVAVSSALTRNASSTNWMHFPGPWTFQPCTSCTSFKQGLPLKRRNWNGSADTFYPDAEDVCNAADDDADGTVDEDFTPQLLSCGVGKCRRTAYSSCVSGTVSSSCTPGTAATEVCNGADDDCDGKSDAEDFATVPELCNGLDDNCNGMVDDVTLVEFSCAATGVCPGRGGYLCQGQGAPSSYCVPDYAFASSDNNQNGLDDDCDGSVDEDYQCAPVTCELAQAECGSFANGCGGTTSCGGCEQFPGTTCSATYDCEPPNGVPTLEAALDATGPVSPLGSTFRQRYGIISEGDQIQKNADESQLDEVTIGAVRGRVLARNPQGSLANAIGIPNIKVTVKGHPEYGYATTRDDGTFDMMINGGTSYVFQFRSTKYLAVDRVYQGHWQHYGRMPDVVMIPLDSGDPVALSGGQSSSQWADSQVVTADDYDSDQTDGVSEPRQTAMLVPPGTLAYATKVDEITGQTVPAPLSTGGETPQIVLQEFTIGKQGGASMPAALPPNTMYTFAFEAFVKAAGPGAKVEFRDSSNAPKNVHLFVDNFLNLPTGSVIPAGYYDPEQAKWVAMPDGVVLKVLNVIGGVASVDITGDGAADSVGDLDLTALGSRYAAGKSVWWVKTTHLSTFDFNLGRLLQKPEAPPAPEPDVPEPTVNDCAVGSILHCQGRRLGEELSVAGTSHTLEYDSGNVPGGATEAYRVGFYVDPSRAPPWLSGLPIAERQAFAVLTVEGKRIEDSMTLPELQAANGKFVLEWDGRNAAGKLVRGPVVAQYSIGWRANPEYVAWLQQTSQPLFASSAATCVLGTPCCSGGAGMPQGSPRTVLPAYRMLNGEKEMFLFTQGTVTLGQYQATDMGLGGWAVSRVRRFDRLNGAVDTKTGAGQKVLHALKSDPYVTTGNFVSASTQWAALQDGSLAVVMAPSGGGDRALQVLRPTRNDANQLATGPVVGSTLFSGTEAFLGGLTAGRDGYIYERRTIQNVATIRRWARQWTTLSDGRQLWAWSPVMTWQLDTNAMLSSLAVDEQGTMFVGMLGPDGKEVISRVRNAPEGGRYKFDRHWVAPIRGKVDVYSNGFTSASRVFPMANGKLWVVIAELDQPDPVPPQWSSTTPILFEVSHDGSWRQLTRWSATAAPDDAFAQWVSPALGSQDLRYHASPDGRRLWVMAAVDVNNLNPSLIHELTVDHQLNMLRVPAAQWAVPGHNQRAFTYSTASGGLPARIYEVREGIGPSAIVQEGLVYRFDIAGRHLQTDDLETGITLETMGYDSAGQLQTVRNAVDGSCLWISRPTTTTAELRSYGPSSSTTCTTAAPLIATTQLLFDTKGYLKQLTQPSGLAAPATATWKFEHDPSGRLLKMWSPRSDGTTSRSQYKEYKYVGGKVESDRAPSGSSQSFTPLPAPLPSVTAIEGTWCDGGTYTVGWRTRAGTSRVQRTTQEGRATEYLSSRVTSAGAFGEGDSAAYQEGAPLSPNAPKSSSPARAKVIYPSGRVTVRDDADGENTSYIAWPGGSATTNRATDPLFNSLYASKVTTAIDAVTVPETRGSLTSTSQASVSYFEPNPVTKTFTTRTETQSVTAAANPLVPTTLSTRSITRVANRSDVNTGGLITVSTDTSAGRHAETTLDAGGRPVLIKMPGQVGTQFYYGNADGTPSSGPYLVRVVRSTASQTREVQFTYDTATNTVRTITALDGSTFLGGTELTSNLYGFATSVSTGFITKITTNQTADIEGAVASVSPPDNATEPYRFKYDLDGRLTSYLPPGASGTGACPDGAECYGYNGDNQVISYQRTDGSLTSFMYGPTTGLLTSVTQADRAAGVTLTSGFTYTADGRLETASVSSPYGANQAATLSYAYQSDLPIQERLTGTWGGASLASDVRVGYNGFGEVASLSVSRDGANPMQVRYLYGKATTAANETLTDADGLLLGVASGLNPGNIPNATMFFRRSLYTGRIREATMSNVRTLFTYDDTDPVVQGSGSNEGPVTVPGFGELKGIKARVNSVDSFVTSYEYDALGRLTRQTEATLGVTKGWKYEYDEYGRLVSVTDDASGISLSLYDYDGNGNRTEAYTSRGAYVPTLGLGNVTRTLNTRTGEYAYSADQPIKLCSGSATRRDEICAYGGYDHRYNALGQLVGRRPNAGASATEAKFDYTPQGVLRQVTIPGKSTISYAFDARGRRIAKLTAGTLTKNWAYLDDLRPVAQFDSSGALEAVFVYATRGNVPEYMVKKNGSSWVNYRFVTDHLGSVRMVVDAGCTQSTHATIAANCVLQRTDYDEFGNIVSKTGDDNLHPFGYAGGLHDRDTGLVRFGAREYDPWMGRWLTRDPIKFAGGQTNLYAYVGNNPVNFKDPSGLYTEVIIWEPVGYGGSSFGHVSVDINGRTYSFAPGGMTAESTERYLARNTDFRSGRGLILGLTPDQEMELENSLSNGQGDYNAMQNNCTDPVERGLSQIASSLQGNSMLPTGLAQNLIDSGLAVGQTAHLGPERPALAAPWTNAVRGSWYNGF